jgi:hypothetical protein
LACPVWRAPHPMTWHHIAANPRSVLVRNRQCIVLYHMRCSASILPTRSQIRDTDRTLGRVNHCCVQLHQIGVVVALVYAGWMLDVQRTFRGCRYSTVLTNVPGKSVPSTGNPTRCIVGLFLYVGLRMHEKRISVYPRAAFLSDPAVALKRYLNQLRDSAAPRTNR